MPKYDSVEAIKAELTDLDGLWRIIQERRTASYDRKERLTDSFIVLRRFYLDNSGNFGVLKTDYPKDAEERIKELADVVSCYELGRVMPDSGFSFSMLNSALFLPKSDTKCPACGRGWTIETAHDAVHYEGGAGMEGLFHKRCYAIKRTQAVTEQFLEIMQDAGFTLFVMNAIPNEYCSCDRCPPWFRVQTIYGDIKMGWRKRVINIEWDFKVPMELFKAEDVTKWESGIHAWGYDAAKKYLESLRLSQEP